MHTHPSQEQEAQASVSFLALPFHKRFGLFLASIAAIAGLTHAVNHTKDGAQIMVILTLTLVSLLVYAYGHHIDFAPQRDSE